MTKKILIVDDSESIRQVIIMALSSKDYELTEANNGKQALTLLDDNKFDLIISDVNMPILDGLSMVAKIKQIEAYQFIPILMLTTESEEDYKLRGKQLGVKAWMVKPFKPEQLQFAVKVLVGP